MATTVWKIKRDYNLAERVYNSYNLLVLGKGTGKDQERHSDGASKGQTQQPERIVILLNNVVDYLQNLMRTPEFIIVTIFSYRPIARSGPGSSIQDKNKYLRC